MIVGPIDADLARQSDQLVELTRIQAMVESEPATYAGFEPGGYERASIFVKAIPGQLAASATSMNAVASIAAEAKTKGISISTGVRKRSLLDLTSVRDQIVRLAPFGGTKLGYEISIDVYGNVLELRVPKSDVAVVSSKAAKMFGDSVRVAAKFPGTEGEVEQAYNRVNDVEPFFAGDQIRGGPSASYCTSGFTITNLYGTRDYAITAGHCYPRNSYITQNSAFFGNVELRNVPANPNQYWFDDELIGGQDYVGVMWRGGLYDPQGLSVHAAANSCGPGCKVWLSAGLSPTNLQTLYATPYCEQRSEGWVCQLQRTTPGGAGHCQAGDSGSPYFAYDGKGGVTAVGNHVSGNASYCTYTSVPGILQRWSSSIKTAP